MNQNGQTLTTFLLLVAIGAAGTGAYLYTGGQLDDLREIPKAVSENFPPSVVSTSSMILDKATMFFAEPNSSKPNNKFSLIKKEDQRSIIGSLEGSQAAPILSPSSGGQYDELSQIPLEYFDQTFTAEQILTDPLNRISEEFKVPANLAPRVKFWLDIYTKYSSRFHIVHDDQKPWIVYRVIDVRPIYNQNVNRFVKDSRERALVKKNVHEVRLLLSKLSRKKTFDSLSEEEMKVYNVWQAYPSNKRKLFAKAATDVRAQKGQKNFYRNGVISSSKYITEMEEIFARYDLPVELVRLPLVESSFNEAAQSKVGASGIWQFMPTIGAKKGLKVGSDFDERNSPIKATEAAAKLMLSNFRIMKSWPLAVSAYNHGPGMLIKASKKLGSHDMGDILENFRMKNFGFASQNFFCEFLAALHGEKYQSEIFGNMPKHSPIVADAVKLRSTLKLNVLLNATAMTFEEFKLFNPDLRVRKLSRMTLLPLGYTVRLPPAKRILIEALLSKSLRNGKRVAMTNSRSVQL